MSTAVPSGPAPRASERARHVARAVRADRSLAVVAGATVVGLVARAVWVVEVARPPQGLYDPARYAAYARDIGAGKGMVEPLTGAPTAYFPPGYPWFLGIIEWVITHTPLLLGIVVLCIVPWTVRNLVRMDAFVPLATNTGDNLCIGHGPEANGRFRFVPAECETSRGMQDGTEAEVYANRERTERGLRAWREGWRDEPRLTVRRFEEMVERDDDALRAVQSYDLDPWIDDGLERTLSRASNVAWFVVGGVGLIGLVKLSWTREGHQLLVPLTALAFMVAPLVTFGDPRFKVPIVPLMALAAAVAITPRRVPRAERA